MALYPWFIIKIRKNGKSKKNILLDIPFSGMDFYKFSDFHSPKLRKGRVFYKFSDFHSPEL